MFLFLCTRTCSRPIATLWSVYLRPIYADVYRFVHAACPPRYGYLWVVSLKAVETFAGFFGSTFNCGNAEKAVARCQINPRCTAWDTEGSIYLYGVKTFTLKAGVCTYLKQSKCTDNMRSSMHAYVGGTYE